MDYAFFQEYWWLLVSVLGALLVFLLFVQGGQSLFFSIGKEQLDRKLLVNSIGRKWEFTFTTLVVFGGGFFASFPLFYSTSFGGAYWVWMLILFCFIIQAVSYEYQNKNGNVLGSRTYQTFLLHQWPPRSDPPRRRCIDLLHGLYLHGEPRGYR